MAFAYTTGIANNAAAFFVSLEAFLVARGWVLDAGGGTTDIIYHSAGESGTLTKLYIRIRRDGVNLERIWGTVRDDAAGTHATTDIANGYLRMPGAGAIPFAYWICGDKNCIVINTRGGGIDYYGIYLGCIASQAITPPDETYYMISAALHLNIAQTKVLRRYDGTWNYTASLYGLASGCGALIYLDGSKSIYGVYIRGADNREIYGQLYFVSLKLYTSSFNSGDLLQTEIGVDSFWIFFGNATNGIYWGVLTQGPINTGDSDGTFTIVNGPFANMAAVDAAIAGLMNGLGWVVSAWHAPAYPTDNYYTSGGESGAEDIRLRLATDNVLNNVHAQCVSDNAAGYQATTLNTINVGAPPWAGRLIADKNCILFDFTIAGASRHFWLGKPHNFFPQETGIPFEYKLASYRYTGIHKVLRSCQTGVWDNNISPEPGAMATSSPNRIDANTYVVWPKAYSQTGMTFVMPYIFYASGGLAINDTITIGAKVYTYIMADIVIRTT